MDGKLTHTGQLGAEHSVESGYEAAQVCALNSLAAIKAALGSLDGVARIVLVSGFVNAVAGFSESPAVINGASDLFVKIFGDAGRHSRAAVAVAGLPRNSTVEIQVVVEVR
jgi:enamine deaminase RidA (YjgF/YER057c/UK114 family)